MSNPWQGRILARIRLDRISTSQIAQCLGPQALLPGLAPLNPGHYRVGPVFWAQALDQRNWGFHEQIRDFPADHVLLVEATGCGQRAVFGELVSKFLMLYRQAQALVVRGWVRDVHTLVRYDWPLWCEGGTPLGCFNRPDQDPASAAQALESGRRAHQGAIAVCDDSGVALIPGPAQGPELLAKLEWVEAQEDRCFDLLDRRKLDTFDILCRPQDRPSDP